jgi:type I restriction enzyme S subunit
MFGDPVTNPFNFPLVPISDIVSNGRSKIDLGDGDVWNLNLDQIEPNTGRVLQKVLITTEKLGTSTFVFQTGTVLYSKLRPYLNKVVVADENGVATTELVPLKCIEALIKPAFLAYFLRSKRFVDFATETVAGAKMPRMMMDAFWSYQLPLPPVSLQNSFNEKINVIGKQRGIQLQSSAEFDNLFASLQHRAFRGEL